jgi:hypothetical protein
MKGSLGLIVTALVLLAASPSHAVVKKSRAHGSGAITIEQWITSTPSATGLSATLKGCFKLRGALSDRGGKPRWTDESFATGAAASQCGAARPVGGMILVPPFSPMANASIYTVQTLAGKRGRIFITLAGALDLATTFTGGGTWVITGGTGAYEDLGGEGTMTGDASAFPYVRHTVSGTVWFADDD